MATSKNKRKSNNKNKKDSMNSQKMLHDLLITGLSFLVVLLLTISPAVRSPSYPAGAQTSLVAHWAFEDGSGTTVSDSSGNNYDGTTAGNPTWTSGHTGGALSFDGTNDNVSLPSLSSSIYGTNARTIMFWFNAHAFSTGLSRTMVTLGNGPQGGGLWIFAEDNGVSVGFNGHRIIFEKGNLSTNNWYHFALVVPQGASTNQVVGYIDGTQRTLATEGGSTKTINTNPTTPFLGSDVGSNNFFDGLLDEVKIFDEALTANQVANEYNPPVQDSTPPSVPTNLAATAVSSSQINLSWTASTDNIGVVGYKIYRNGNLLTTVSGTSQSNTNLTPSTTYTYRVSAIDAAGNESAQSSQAQATTHPSQDTVPPVISNITTTPVSQTHHRVNWITSEPATSRVEYGLTTSYGLSTATSTTLVTSHNETADGLAAGATYNFRVHSQDGAGNLTVSGNSTFTTLPPVSGGGLVGHWKLDELSGAVADDATGAGNTGMVLNGPGWSWVAGKVNGGLKLDGSNDYVEVPNNPILNPSSEVSVAAWINPLSNTTSQNIISKVITSNNQYLLRIQGGTGGKLRFITKANSLVTLQSNSAVPANNWTHVAATYDGSTMKIYINGILDATTNQSGTMNDSGDPLTIGSNRGNGLFFNGTLDEVRLYDRALLDTEVQQLYSPPTNDTTPPVVSVASFAPGTLLSNTARFRAEASDNVAVAGVRFFINGNAVGAEDTIAPYEIQVNTASLSNSQHTITASARDTAGLTTISGPVTVSVDNVSARPNIVVVMTDDQSYNTMQYMPLTNARFAANGVSFSHSVTGGPICCPSRAGYLTGEHVHNHGVLGNLPPYGALAFNDNSTLARWLQDAGYKTGLYGKYLNEYETLAPYIPPGWSEWHVFDSGNGEFYNYSLNENGTSVSYGSSAQDYSTDVLGQKAVQFIQSTPNSQPFFVTITPQGPHEPYTPAPQDIGSLNGVAPYRPPSHNEADVSDKPAWIQSKPIKDAAGVALNDTKRQSYLEALASIDRVVDDIFEALESTGKLQNTLVIFTADHGLSWGEHRWFQDKDCAYEACYRMPLLVAVPGATPRVEASLVGNTDVTATIADISNVEPVTTIRGTSLLPLIADQNAPWTSEELIETLGRAAQRKYWAVRVPQYIYTEYANGDREFYDYAIDPYELDNRVNDPNYAAIISTLQARLNTLKNQ